jgi:DNA-binding NtrC family response regulator
LLSSGVIPPTCLQPTASALTWLCCGSEIQSKATRNVRELENAVEHAVALGSGPLLHVGDLPSNLQQYSNEEALDSNELTTLDEVERRFIFRALREANGDKLAAARLLGMGKTTLYRKLKQYGAKSAPN